MQLLKIGDSSKQGLKWLLLGVFVLGLCSVNGLAQSGRSTKPDVGVRYNPPSAVVLTNATVHVDSVRSLESSSVLLQDGRISKVGQFDIPAGAEIIDCDGDHLYPGFVEAFAEFESSEYSSQIGHWSPQMTPGRRMSELVNLDPDKLAALRKNGFGITLAAPSDGIMKGFSCLLSTAEGGLETALLRDTVFQHIRTYPNRSMRGTYPNSPMGAVAIVRQTLSDARWYSNSLRMTFASPEIAPPERSAPLDALAEVIAGQTPVLIDGSNELYALRADRLAREFALRLVIRGSGREYRRLDAIADTHRKFIVPIDFPDAPEVSSQQEVADASLQDLMHWNLAPENPKLLEEAGIDFVISSEDSDKDFLKNLRLAVERGLSEEAAIDAITIGPAELLGIGDIAGTIQPGKVANLVRTDGPLLDDDSEIVSVWVDGHEEKVDEADSLEIAGDWDIAFSDSSLAEIQMELEVSGDSEKPKLVLEIESAGAAETDEEEDENEIELKNAAVSDYRIGGAFDASEAWNQQEGMALISAAILNKEDGLQLVGTVQWPDGQFTDFVATPESDEDDEEGEAEGDEEEEDVLESSPSDSDVAFDEDEDSEQEEVASEQQLESFVCEINYPLGAYGLGKEPEQFDSLVLRNATIWTCGPAGKMEEADLWISGSEIKAVGKDLQVTAGTQEVDATGMHISPGIIDCHSHMATDGGVNESGQAVTAEVRIGDFIDPNDITIYRQLAGGVTTSNILHGSANPIGGQNQVIKLRWGSLGEAMKMEEAPGGIKFALGENVKQSNRGDEYRTRYPQTRMGVEQIMRDRFEAAKLYRQDFANWTLSPSGLPPRKDYELEAIAEILEGKRWIHCHSYRQDEILAMLRTLDDYGVTIGSLQHILEGYKVADAMAKHGATGSSFSDWWAYKFEVYDAIPYNGAIMHNAGVIVSFNSDDRELARHLNHEAAKAVKYGRVPEEEALKFVTLNPAKQLRIDQWVGSLEPGKHADFAVWNRSPLSTLSACQETWVDGRKYFDRDDDKQRREQDAILHRKLVKLITDGDAKTGPRKDDDPSYWWARYDEFCHHNDHEHDDDHGHDHHDDHESHE